jgi:hypothetical protein
MANANRNDHCWSDFTFCVAAVNDQSPPQSWIDFYLLDQIIRPLTQARLANDTWNIHRRWGVRDGHQFKFSCFADRGVATDGDHFVRSLPAWQTYRDRIAQWQPEADRYRFQPLTAQTDDWRVWENWWPTECLPSWSFFIHGVSRTLLELIEDVRQSRALVAPNPTDVQACEEFYRHVERLVQEFWSRYGQDVYLHHINAVFGYDAVNCRFRARGEMSQVIF